MNFKMQPSVKTSVEKKDETRAKKNTNGRVPLHASLKNQEIFELFDFKWLNLSLERSNDCENSLKVINLEKIWRFLMEILWNSFRIDKFDILWLKIMKKSKNGKKIDKLV